MVQAAPFWVASAPQAPPTQVWQAGQATQMAPPLPQNAAVVPAAQNSPLQQPAQAAPPQVLQQPLQTGPAQAEVLLRRQSAAVVQTPVAPSSVSSHQTQPAHPCRRQEAQSVKVAQLAAAIVRLQAAPV